MEWYNEGCGGVITKPTGTLTSPNYPKQYSTELRCLWEINVAYGMNIELTIDELHLEKCNDCNCDYLAVATDKNFNETITKVCNDQREPTIVKTDGHKLFVEFNSDSFNGGRGFKLSYKSIVSDCGGRFTSPQGIISTPNYPSKNYEHNKNCEWNIKAEPSHSISFQLLDFDLESSENCTKDVLEVYDPIFNEIIWSGCGSQMPNQSVFESNRNELNIRLKTDNETNAKGFKGNFSTNCGGRILANDSGEFSYNKNSNGNGCTWTIVTSDPSQKIALTFTHISVPFDFGQCLFEIKVFEGETVETGALKTSFCGQKSPPAIFSNGNALTIRLDIYISLLNSVFITRCLIMVSFLILMLSHSKISFKSRF
jgi:cubilin